MEEEQMVTILTMYKYIVLAATLTVMGVAFVLTGAIKPVMAFCVLTTKMSPQALIIMVWAIIIFTLIIIGKTMYEDHEKEIYD
ncbi:MAG: hypothetical protein KAS32_01685 [Candidatus Peribacteraceae bacterium]|nr:hypothetical protein [Candidatus Peribacteraceae bacterium]